MARFDDLQRTAVTKVHNLYADVATWAPSGGGPLQSGSMLFKDPTRDMEISDVTFSPSYVFAEYHEGNFVGLREAANANLDEFVVINGVEYDVRVVRKKYDGKTNIAILEPR